MAYYVGRDLSEVERDIRTRDGIIHNQQLLNDELIGKLAKTAAELNNTKNALAFARGEVEEKAETIQDLLETGRYRNQKLDTQARTIQNLHNHVDELEELLEYHKNKPTIIINPEAKAKDKKIAELEQELDKYKSIVSKIEDTVYGF